MALPYRRSILSVAEKNNEVQPKQEEISFSCNGGGGKREGKSTAFSSRTISALVPI
jgi:hypothetical protein